ncbi:MAG: hypothetical protein QM715_20465 [Nibricoccus sp.]
MTEADLDVLYHALPPRPTRTGRVESLNVRPGPAGEREAREKIQLDPARGAIGDRWERKTWLHLPDGRPDPRVQLALCNTSLLALMQQAAGTQHHPGDTLFTNLDLSVNHLPVGSRLRAGTAIIEISDVENDACAKFAAHYGDVIFQWIRRPDNRPLRLRGCFARVVECGVVSVGDLVQRL